MFKKKVEVFNGICNEISEANEVKLSKAGSGITLCNKTLTDLKRDSGQKRFQHCTGRN